MITHDPAWFGAGLIRGINLQTTRREIMGKTAFLGAAVLLAGVSASSMASAGWQAYFIENYTGNVASGTAWTQNDSNRV